MLWLLLLLSILFEFALLLGGCLVGRHAVIVHWSKEAARLVSLGVSLLRRFNIGDDCFMSVAKAFVRLYISSSPHVVCILNWPWRFRNVLCRV